MYHSWCISEQRKVSKDVYAMSGAKPCWCWIFYKLNLGQCDNGEISSWKKGMWILICGEDCGSELWNEILLKRYILHTCCVPAESCSNIGNCRDNLHRLNIFYLDQDIAMRMLGLQIFELGPCRAWPGAEQWRTVYWLVWMWCSDLGMY